MERSLNILNSRERIRRVLDHKVPDRIPIDMGGSFCSGISAIAYNRLRKRIGVNSYLSKMYDFNQQLAYPEKEVIDLFHIDVIDAGQAFMQSNDNWREWILNDGSKCLIPKYLNIEIDNDNTVFLKNGEGLILGKKPRSSLYIDQTYWVYKDMPNLPDKFNEEDLIKNNWSQPIPPFHLDIFKNDEYEQFVKNISMLYKTTDYSIFLGLGCSIIEMGFFLRGFDNFLCDIYLDKKRVIKLLEKLTDGYMSLIEKAIAGVGKYVDVLFFGDDIAGEDRLFFPPEVFRKIFMPYYKKMFKYVHENSSCKIFFHCCGSVFNVIPELIDSGIDILSPVQTSAAGMEPYRLKKEFGEDIIFWGGGVDNRRVLPAGTPEEVKEDVKKRINIFGKNGGFVFNNIHNIQADVPPENIIAMLEAAYEYGKY